MKATTVLSITVGLCMYGQHFEKSASMDQPGMVANTVATRTYIYIFPPHYTNNSVVGVGKERRTLIVHGDLQNGSTRYWNYIEKDYWTLGSERHRYAIA